MSRDSIQGKLCLVLNQILVSQELWNQILIEGFSELDDPKLVELLDFCLPWVAKKSNPDFVCGEDDNENSVDVPVEAILPVAFRNL